MENLIKPPDQRQNLVKQISVDKATRSPGFYKLLFLDTLAPASALAGGLAYQRYVLGLSSVGWLVGGIGFFFICSLFDSLFSHSASRRAVIVGLEVFCWLVPLYGTPWNVMLLVAVILGVFFAWGEYLTRKELLKSLEIRFFGLARTHTTKLVTALTLMFIVLYSPELSAGKNFLPEQNFRGYYDGMARLAERFYPEIDFNSNFQSFAEDVVRLKAEEDAAFRDLTPTTQEETVRAGVEQLTAKLSETWGIPVSSDEPLHTVFYQFFTSAIKKWDERLQDVFLVTWVIALFFVIRGTAAALSWIVIFAAFVLYELLIAANFAVVANEHASREVLQFYEDV